VCTVGGVPRKQVQSQPKLRLLAAPRQRTTLLGVILVVAIIALYFPVGNHPFINFDDDRYVYQNPQVQDGLTSGTVHWAFTTFYQANWHPITWLSHALDWQLFEENAGGHHDTNLLLHVSNALLLYWVLLRATGYGGRSFMVAALFALHPINVETVAWVSERKNLLSMMFFLLALGAYRWYVSRPRVSRYAVVAVLYACGLMSKPQVITFPCVLLLWDYWPLRRIASQALPTSGETAPAPIPSRSLAWLLREKAPLFALSAASAIITIKAQRLGGAIQPYAGYIRLENAVVSYARYLGKLFWPSALSPMYPHPGDSLRVWQAAAALLLLLAITSLVTEARQRRYLVVGWCWFLGTLVPMIGLVQVGSQAMADRYAYLPFIGLFIMVCWGVGEWAEQRHLARIWLGGISVCVLLVLTVVARRQVEYWADNITLWTHALKVTTNNYIAEDNLGGAFLDLGELEQAIPHFFRAAAIWPGDPLSNLDIGFYYAKHNNYPAAIEQYNKVLALTPGKQLRMKAYLNLGYAYREVGDYVQSRDNLKQALALDPQNGEAWVYLGVAAQRSGDLPLAVQAYSRGMARSPSDWGYVLLADALQQSGRTEESQRAMQQAEHLTLDLEHARRNAARALNH
jgi:protein O-mannosyl-transferase